MPIKKRKNCGGELKLRTWERYKKNSGAKKSCFPLVVYNKVSQFYLFIYFSWEHDGME